MVVDGLVLFLPGVLERLKFTHALVANSHLAMAGLFTSLNCLMLISLPCDHGGLLEAAPRAGWLEP